MITKKVVAYTKTWGMAGFAICLKHSAKNPGIIDEYTISTRQQLAFWQETVKCGRETLSVEGIAWAVGWCAEHSAPMIMLHVNLETVAITFDEFGIYLLNGLEHEDVYPQGEQ